MRKSLLHFLPFLVLLGTASMAQSQTADPIPVGLDAYRMGPMALSADRHAGLHAQHLRPRGGNESADASHFLYQLADDFNVTLDVEGPGMLYFVRYNHWHGSPWHYEVDGTDHLVGKQHGGPVASGAGLRFSARERRSPALSWTWAATKGADLSWVRLVSKNRSGWPIRARTTERATTSTTSSWADAAVAPDSKLGRDAPDQDVLDLIASRARDIAPRPASQEEAAQSMFRLRRGSAV